MINRYSAIIGTLLVSTSVFLAADSFAAGGACSKIEVNKLFLKCAAPGAACGGVGCVCRDVVSIDSLITWRDCYCIPSGATGGGSRCDTGGRWKVVSLAPIAINSGLSVVTIGEVGNNLQIFDPVNTIDTGTDVVIAQATSLGFNQVDGFIDLHIGNGPADNIPVMVLQLDFIAASFPFGGAQTGPNEVALDPLAPTTFGRYNSLTGTIIFETPIPCVTLNNLYPAGIPTMVSPSMSFGGPGLDPNEAFLIMHSESLLPGPPPPSCPGDADGNELVNFADVTSVLGNWLSDCTIPPAN